MMPMNNQYIDIPSTRSNLQFSGQYTGTDFLINALLLLAAYLLVTSFVIRRLVTWRAGHLLNQITSVARAAVNERGEAARRGVSDTTQRMRDALRRLANLPAAWRERLGQGPPP